MGPSSANGLGLAPPLAASASESSVASQLLPMEGEDHEMSCSAAVSETATEPDPPKKNAEEDLVSHILVDNDSEMLDAESQVKPVEEPSSARNPGETPLRSNLDDTAGKPALFTPETEAELRDTTAAAEPTNSNAGVSLRADNAHGDAWVPNKMAFNSIPNNQNVEAKDGGGGNQVEASENEDDDDEDMSSELSAGDDLQVSFWLNLCYW